MDQQENERLQYQVPFFQVPDALVKDERTGIYHLAVFSALALHANKARRAWPSLNRVCKLVRSGRKKVRETIQELEDWGWLTVIRTRDADGLNHTNVYELSPSLGGGCSQNPGVGSHRTQGGCSQNPEPDKENQTDVEPALTEGTDVPDVDPPVPMTNLLDRYIDERFRAVQLYENFGRERRQIKVISSRCRRANVDDPQKAADFIIDVFGYLRESDTWWGDKPFIPSELVMNWDKVVHHGRKAKRQIEDRVWWERFKRGEAP